MGQSYAAKIVVGLPRGEINNQDLINEDEIEVCSPYYDGGGDKDAIAGLTYQETDTYSSAELKYDLGKINDLKEQFFELTGQKARVYLSTYGY